MLFPIVEVVMTMKKESMTFLLSSTVALVFLTIGLVPVFASTTTVSPTFANGEDWTGGLDCTAAKCKAEFNGHGTNYLYSESDSWEGPNGAIVRTNHKVGSVTYDPTHVTSSSVVGLAADIDFNGNITYGFGSLVDHETGPTLYLKVNGNWEHARTCLFLIKGGDSMSGSMTQKCTHTAVGTDKEYRIGATQKTSAYSGWTATSIADFWNGSYYSKIEQLRICDGGC